MKTTFYERNRGKILAKRKAGYKSAKQDPSPQKCSFCRKEVPKRRVRNKKAFCNAKCKAEWQRTQKPVDGSWLYQKYIVEGMSCVQIAELVNRDSKRVWEWLRDLGIPRRPRGFNWKDNLGFWLRGDPSPFSGRKHTKKTKRKLREARIRDGHVPYLKDGIHWLKGKSGPETPNWKGGITPERQAFYGSKEWKRAERKVKERDNGVCQRCGRDKKKEGKIPFDIHHIVGFSCKKLRCEVDNLITLCEPCHYWVHSSKNTKRRFIRESASP